MSKVGYIYFLKPVDQPGPIKIGHTGHVPSRVQNIQSGSPLRLELLASFPGTLAAERRLHERFGSDRQHGEWFAPSDLLWKVIRGETPPPEEKAFSTATASEHDYIPAVPQYRPVPPTKVRLALSHKDQDRYFLIEEMLLGGKTLDQIAFALNAKPKTVLGAIEKMARLGFGQGPELAVAKEFADDMRKAA